MNRGTTSLRTGVACLAGAGACALLGVSGTLMVVVLVAAILAAVTGVAAFVVGRRA